MDNLMKLKKVELVRMIVNLAEECDSLFDKVEFLKEELREVKTYEDQLHSFEIANDLMAEIKNAQYKLDLGVETEQETIDNLMDKLTEVLK